MQEILFTLARRCDTINASLKSAKGAIIFMYREKIEAYFEEHREEMIRDIMDLVKIRSVQEEEKPGKPYGDGPAAALDAALTLAKNYGFTDIENDDHYVGVVTMGEGDVQLGILAHLDVVPEGKGWTVCEPYAPVIRDDKIFGRGSSDDKGPAMAALYALRCVKDLKIPLKRKVRLILGTAEETGSTDIAHYFAKHDAPPMVFSPDGEYPILNTEKGQLRPDVVAEYAESTELPRIRAIDGGQVLNAVPPEAEAVVEGLSAEEVRPVLDAAAAKTGAAYEVNDVADGVYILAKGKNAHASTPAEGNNAVTALITALVELPLAESEGLTKLRALARLMPHGETDGSSWGINCADEISGPLTITLDIFHYSETAFRGSFDSRVPLCGGEERLFGIMKEAAEKNGLGAELIMHEPPHHTPEDTPLIEALKKIYADYTGREAKCVSMGGGTYVHDIEGGVGFGCVFPEEDTRMHGPDEFMPIADLMISGKMFAQAIADLCGE